MVTQLLVFPRQGDFSKVAEGLYIGGAPEAGKIPFDVLILAADEYQPPSESYPGVQVVHVPMLDESPARAKDLSNALYVAHQAARLWGKGKRVLVTCVAGLNRSGLIVALMLVLRLKLSAESAMTLLRQTRSPWALNNESFVAFVRYVAEQRRSR